MPDRTWSEIASDITDYLPVDSATSYTTVLARIERRLGDLKHYGQREDLLANEGGGFTPAEAAFALVLADLMRLERLGGYRISECLEAMVRAYKS